jgi:hypothetical protein
MEKKEEKKKSEPENKPNTDAKPEDEWFRFFLCISQFSFLIT